MADSGASCCKTEGGETGAHSNECCGRGTLDQGTPAGSEQQVAGLPCYVAGGASSAKPDTVLVIITDVFGWRLNNVRLIADKYAQRLGVPVYVPDLHTGDALDAEKFGWMADAGKVSVIFVGCNLSAITGRPSYRLDAGKCRWSPMT